MSRIALAAPAKVNLQLDILGREASGHHLLETVFQTLELADELVVERDATTTGAQRISLDCSDPQLSSGPDNLAWQAAAAFLERRPELGGLRLHIDKRIPIGGGLGGGSSDAAAVLRACNRLDAEPLPETELVAIARELGADVCFFLTGGTAHGRGRGDRITALPDLPPTPCWLLLPGFGCSTPAVYAALSPIERVPRAPLGPEHDWAAEPWHNRLTAACLRSHPALAGICRRLSDAGIDWLLCGSGSTLLCREPVDAGALGLDLRVIATAFRPRARLDALAPPAT